MEYRIGLDDLMETLVAWDRLVPGRGKVRLIACGGTALTLLGYKESTKDVDFLVPNEKECERLTRFLQKAGYSQVTGYGWQRPDDCLFLLRREKMDLRKLERRFNETAKYDVGEEMAMKNWKLLVDQWKKKNY